VDEAGDSVLIIDMKPLEMVCKLCNHSVALPWLQLVVPLISLEALGAQFLEHTLRFCEVGLKLLGGEGSSYPAGVPIQLFG